MCDSIFKTMEKTSDCFLVVKIATYYFVMSNDYTVSNTFLKKNLK